MPPPWLRVSPGARPGSSLSPSLAPSDGAGPGTLLSGRAGPAVRNFSLALGRVCLASASRCGIQFCFFRAVEKLLVMRTWSALLVSRRKLGVLAPQVCSCRCERRYVMSLGFGLLRALDRSHGAGSCLRVEASCLSCELRPRTGARFGAGYYGPSCSWPRSIIRCLLLLSRLPKCSWCALLLNTAAWPGTMAGFSVPIWKIHSYDI